jgi:hypothetical protein
VYALGLAPGLREAVAILSDPDAAAPGMIEPDPAMAAVYARTRAVLPGLVASLAGLAAPFEPPGTGENCLI